MISIERLREDLPKLIFSEDQLLSKHTTMKVGGPATIFVEVKSKEELIEIVQYLIEERVEYMVIGNGSNLIFSDSGFDGVIVKNTSQEIAIEKNILTVSSGFPLSKLATFALKNNLTGLEFAYGIPGTVGGAVIMNAGAYDGEMSRLVVSTEYIDQNGQIKILEKNEHKFSYRHSFFKENPQLVILSTTIKLMGGSYKKIKAKMEDFTKRRKEKQPLDMPSAGSTFKRPMGYFAGDLIERAGLKGFRIGDAAISEKHAGFVVNLGDATAEDIIQLMEHIKSEVKRQFNVDLESEVIIV